MLKLLKIFAIGFCFCNTINAQTYSKVKINLSPSHTMAKLAQIGLPVDHCQYKKNSYCIVELSSQDLELLNQNNFTYTTLIEDLQRHYVNANKQIPEKSSNISYCLPKHSYTVPTGFTLGSMAGYFTYAEALAHLDNLAALYPNIISAKAPISNTLKTFENRPLYWLKISDNPNTDEAEPELLFTSLHHSREPMSLSQLVYYMYYLCENYATNAEVKYIVDNTEQYFIPIVNPDGYIYNETNFPNGGGMWRKNRRDNGNGTFGVDLNRNYGYGWGADDQGSSPLYASDTYRGTAPFSEPETQLIRDFANAHQFKIALNYHTFSNLIVYPWAFSPQPTDSLHYKEIGDILTQDNHFSHGNDIETVGYSTNGSSDDWMYGETVSKPKIMAMTPEAGPDNYGFWPPSSAILDLCQDNLYANLSAAKLVLPYAYIADNTNRYLVGTTQYVKYTLKNAGFSISVFTVGVSASGSLVLNTGANKVHNLAPLQEVSDSILITLGTGIAINTAIDYVLTVNNGLFEEKFPQTKKYGQPVIANFSDNSSLLNWDNNGNTWGVTTEDGYNSASSIADSPNALTSDNTYASIQTLNTIDLTNAFSATLTYKAKWDIERSFDYVACYIIDENNLLLNSALCGKLTRPGSAFQANQMVYDGKRLNWSSEEINLDDYVGQNIKIGLMSYTDGAITKDGFYFDDFKVEKLVNTSSALLEENTLTFQLYPNPANAKVNVLLSTENIGSVFSIVNALGQEVLSQTITQTGLNTINIEALQSGLYYCKVVKNNTNSSVRKLMVVR
jgi:carboxypeptidase T